MKEMWQLATVSWIQGFYLAVGLQEVFISEFNPLHSAADHRQLFFVSLPVSGKTLKENRRATKLFLKLVYAILKSLPDMAVFLCLFFLTKINRL